ncbi:MAG: hypothetical protein A2827_01535 [Candidatus Spechtbacteria bacterium RIFCSPHIGHO2_01_FULL_43_30]|uniref:Uncharacterized protein n=1 Tax=Candidatus Spechtbacteria bacterium RIFCSPHIGHO2_01_FULL_43_30 TaxID=1802158 RepID=A0A1G2H480_9BACT|nr:MAG: hypothetical protein A2827_01535 [Candidatus Spechtbacteria bacterium RIFCSPHIGHO2_01_FULL_43_30]
MDGITWRIDTIIFAIIAILGVVILILSFILGEVFDFFSHDIDVNIGGHDAFNLGNSGDVPNAGSLVNVQSVLAFMSGFGGLAWILSGYLKFSPMFSVLLGLLGGIVAAIPMILLMRILYKKSGSAGFNMQEVTHRTASVVLDIPPNGLGRVQYEINGSLITSTARSATGESISAGTTVRIEQVIGSEVSVRKV